MAAELLTYGDTSRVDDVVLNAVEALTATESQIANMIGKTRARDTVHSYLVDTLATAGTLAVEMGRDFSNTAVTVPSRLTNIVEEIAKQIVIARPQEAVEHYFGQDMTNYQVSKALKDFGNALEVDLILSTLASGVSGTTAKMSGILEAVSKASNTTVHTSGTVFSATILDGLMQNNWTSSNGDVATDLFVGGIMKRVIDGFVQKTNNLVNVGDAGRIVRTVTTYETSFGTLTVHKHRYVQTTNGSTDGATGRVLGIRPEKLAVAWLDMPTVMTDLTKAGAYSKRAVYGSCTLEVRNQDSHFWSTGFLKAA
jgi:hypothetical protein